MTTLTAEHPPQLDETHTLTPPQGEPRQFDPPESPRRHLLLDQPLRTDAHIEERVMSTIGTACRHQLWLLMLTSADLQVPLAFPCDDFSVEPDKKQANVLLAFIAGLMADRGATQLIAVWERPGRGALSPADARWAQLIAHSCERRGIPLRAQLLSHSRGVCLLGPADLASSDSQPADQETTDSKPAGPNSTDLASADPKATDPRVGAGAGVRLPSASNTA
ncbi:hypothetical protein [Subtercola lobariae]|uniref:Uncharacterized protein n=1 Tax=Subtercola lobariae TaxID=1588641 RepID=A0A917BD93_9MICO|nr:hypothetical protein [Subtercola lobariae]GGF37335.1 hypothetical protein GCM10011399_32850 [Subtercola lobariae]